MPQNFNITPYNDDFDETKHFYRVLFRPSVAVQARELTQSQSILQQQIKYLGDSIYQHGSMVIPGQAAIDPKTNYVRLQPTYGLLGSTPIPINMSLFVDQTIQGSITGLKAQVIYNIDGVGTESPTLYVKYLNTGLHGETTFLSNEYLALANSSTTMAQIETNAPTGFAVTAQIDEGVYYIWGFFVRVEKQYLVLGKYTNIVSKRIGLQIVESIVTPEEDPSLNDNAQGSPNYAAPGAHRYKIDLILTSKEITDTSTDQTFVEVIRVVNSVIQKKVSTDTYSVILKEMAQRMNDANGDFAIRNFAIDVRESLDTAFVTEGLATAASVAVDPLPAKISLASSASAVDNAYNNMQIYLSNGAGAGQNFVITAYVGSTKTASLDHDYNPNQVADITTEYIISDPTKINRGIYPPEPPQPDLWPGPYGDIDRLAVGMEPGRAYVDGYRIDTLSTIYVDMDKARESDQTTSAFVPTPIGSFMFVKNLYNIPIPAASTYKDFLVVNFGPNKVNPLGPSAFDITTSLGTARVHAIEFFQGSSPSGTDAVFKMYLFDIKMNAGVNINNVRSFHVINTTDNSVGNLLSAAGDVCTAFSVANVNGTGLVPTSPTVGTTIVTGPSNFGTEILVSYDAINNNIITEPNVSNSAQITTSGSFSAVFTPHGGGSTQTATGVLSARTQIFNTQQSTLIYPLPQQMVKTIENASGNPNTGYYIRQMFEAQINGSGQYIFNSSAHATFAQQSSTDYLATIVSEPHNPVPGANVGKIISIPQMSFSGSPANTQISFTISAGVGSYAGTVIKLMATLYKTVVSDTVLKTKALTEGLLQLRPTSTVSLGYADIVSIEHIYEKLDGVVFGTNNAGDWAALAAAGLAKDIKSQYKFDTGQRDYYYDVGNIIKNPAAPGPGSQTPGGPLNYIGIVFKYYAHSGSGDYFSVDSYVNQVDYDKIPTYYGSNGKFYVLRDCLDFRPRIGATSGHKNFAIGDSSYSASLKPDTVTTCDFQYYLGRIDKIYLDQYGKFNITKGISALVPTPPPDPIDGMMLYTIQLNPYTLSTTDLKIVPTKNPRYTMHDIGKLEDRIANLEYYTSLNQLETQTATYSVTDTKTGLDRFKNGFVVDNFTGHTVGNVFDNDYRCAIDPSTNQLRPLFVQNNNTLMFNSDASAGYVNRSNLLMLPYTETITIQQQFATDILNVNPFAIFTYYGVIALIPSTDTWKSTIQRPVINVDDKSQLAGYQYLNQWSGATWGDWQTTWVGVPQTTNTSSVTSTTVQNGAGGAGDAAAYIANLVASDFSNNHFQWTNGLGDTLDILNIGGQNYATGPEWSDQQSTDVVVQGGAGGGATTTETTTTTATTTQQIKQTRVASETMVTAQMTKQTINNAVVDVSLSPYIRSRRIKVVGRHFKPSTRLYPFFDGMNVSGFCRPFADPQITPSLTGATWTSQAMTWGGDYNPYINFNSGTSSDPNDTGQKNTYLTGPLGDPIYSDSIGTVTLFFEIPCTDANEFRVGVRPFRLTDSAVNANTADSYGDANYNASGLLEQNQETITSIYTPEILTKQVSESQVLTQNLGSTTTESTSTTTTPGAGGGELHLTLWMDPVAQSFLVKEKGGCYVTSIDVYFQTADDSVPITMQIRNMVNGYPGQDVVPFSEKVLYPNQPTLSALTRAGTIPNDTIDPITPAVINLSDNASVATRFVFDAPVFLNDGTEYAFVLIANSTKYNIYTAKIGGTVVGTTNIVSTPPYLGSCFKSQNASTWVADPSQNLKFTINKAVFDPTQTGTLYFTNSSVQDDTLLSMPFQTVNGSNLVRVYHKNHMMPKGEYSNSIVAISNVADAGVDGWNGLSASDLNGHHSITNVDLNSYCIQVTGTATADGRCGPDGVVATRNIQFDAICPVVNQLSPSGTAIGWYGLFTSGKSVNVNTLTPQEPYVQDSGYSPISVNATSLFASPRMIASDINETTNISSSAQNLSTKKSMVLQAIMATTSVNLTPIVDLTRVSTVLVNNLIDDPTFDSYTLTDMDQGATIESGEWWQSHSNEGVYFDSKVVMSIVGVTGGQFTPNLPVQGAASNASGTVVSWDGTLLTLSGVSGIFQDTEAVSGTSGGTTVIGTCEHFEYLNTLTNWVIPNSGPPITPGTMDFSVFFPGYAMNIAGCGVNKYGTPYGFGQQYDYPPVTILAVNGNQITVDALVPFTPAAAQKNIQLTQFNRFVAESGPSGCTTACHYITKQFTLAQAANSLKILFTINRPPGSFVDVYYRILAANNTQAFGSITWKPLVVDDSADTGESTDPNQFKEYVYTANNIGSFTAFSIKLTMRGGNSSQVPRVQDFRGIALGT